MQISDSIDFKILRELQRDARVSNHDLAKRVGLSPSPCWRRVKRLEETGVIQGYAALLDPESVGLNLVAYAQVHLENHHGETVREFDEAVESRPEILECCSMSGDYDYLLKVVVANIKAYEEFQRTFLTQIRAIRSVSTSFVLKHKKQTTELPLALTAAGSGGAS
jgi:DNA-binding Lrp family transcriptional regulator